jgi:hypothetical protein
MPNNGSTGVVIGSQARITVGVLLSLVGLALLAISGWATVWSQACNALPRAEAHQTFVTRTDYIEDRRELYNRLDRIEQKIDHLKESR